MNTSTILTTRNSFAEKSDQVQLTDQDLEIVAGGTKPKTKPVN